MEPTSKTLLADTGNDEKRIGNNKRAMTTELAPVETLINQNTPFPAAFDVRPIQDPYFSEFLYTDMLNGLNLATLSAGVNALVAEKALALPASGQFPIDKAADKYVGKRHPDQKYPKVVFLPGSNAMQFVCQSTLLNLIDNDEDWWIKPHPLTQKGTLRKLASLFGWRRIIHPDTSGFALLKNATEVAAAQTSELFLVARYMGKPVTDITDQTRNWLCTYHHICRLLKNDNEDTERLNRLLMSDLSGHIRPEYPIQLQLSRIKNYVDCAMEVRDRFYQPVNQRLAVTERSIKVWG